MSHGRVLSFEAIHALLPPDTTNARVNPRLRSCLATATGKRQPKHTRDHSTVPKRNAIHYCRTR